MKMTALTTQGNVWAAWVRNKVQFKQRRSIAKQPNKGSLSQHRNPTTQSARQLAQNAYPLAQKHRLNSLHRQQSKFPALNT